MRPVADHRLVTLTDVSRRIAVDEADLRVLLTAMEEDPEHLDDELADELVRMLSPNGERSL